MLNQFRNILLEFSERPALCIKDRFFTYNELERAITSISKEIKLFPASPTKLIGIVTTDTFETYASFWAAWFSGLGFVPINPKNPKDRNNNIIQQAEIELVLSSTADISAIVDTSNLKVICTQGLISEEILNEVPIIPESQVLCILFTSGSTGIPKGVPMNYKNITATLDSFWALDYKLDHTDKFLQMFEFTFDMSMLSYLPAFLLGACVYSVADAKVKYMAAIKTMQKHNITFAAMVPSTLAFVRPYFKELRFESLKYSVLGGEPFYFDIAQEWMRCVPNAQIVNISGPTETTMACMGYNVCENSAQNKSHNGILAFGRAWKNTTAIVVDENLDILQPEIQGELCFAGDNVMEGYWKMPERNHEVFFIKEINGKSRRFYRTGDMAYIDSEGDFMTCGRIDQQIKIQGHKVELAEIEIFTRDFTQISNVAAIAAKDINGFTEIFVCLENKEVDENAILNFLKSKLPWYMVPKKIIGIGEFPRNLNGKIDKPALAILLKNQK